MSKPRFSNLRTNAPIEKNKKIIEDDRVFTSTPTDFNQSKWVTSLGIDWAKGYKHAITVDLETNAPVEADKSLAMEKWEYRLFLISCLFWSSVALLAMAGVIMYVFNQNN